MLEVTTNYVESVQAIGKARAETGKRVEDIIRKCCEMILEKSRTYVPVDLGPLIASGRIEVTGKGLGCRGRVIYGNADVDYAIYVHEDETKYHEPPTGTKFVSRSVRELRGSMSAMAKRTLKIGRV